MFPAVCYVNMMLEIANIVNDGNTRLRVHNMRFLKFLFFSKQGVVQFLTTAVSQPGSDDGLWSVGVWSGSSTSEWTLHATGQIDLRCDENKDAQTASVSRGNTQLLLSTETLRQRCAHESSDTYTAVFEKGLQLGPAFRCAKHIHIDDDATQALIYAEVPNEIRHDFRQYVYHPVFFDDPIHSKVLMDVIGGMMRAERLHEPFHYTTEVPYSFREVRHIICLC